MILNSSTKLQFHFALGCKAKNADSDRCRHIQVGDFEKMEHKKCRGFLKLHFVFCHAVKGTKGYHTIPKSFSLIFVWHVFTFG